MPLHVVTLPNKRVSAIVIGNLLATGALLLSSLAGSYYHSWFSINYDARRVITNGVASRAVGFPVVSRAVWGIWGSQFTIWNRIFLSLGELSLSLKND